MIQLKSNICSHLALNFYFKLSKLELMYKRKPSCFEISVCTSFLKTIFIFAILNKCKVSINV